MDEKLVIIKKLKIQEGEVQTYADTDVHFKSLIVCAGTLEFSNCTLHYNEYRFQNGIVTDAGSVLKFINCEIICEGTDEEPFVRGESCKEVVFDGCTFKNCSKFLDISEEIEEKLRITHCHMINCFDKFINVHIAEEGICSITDTEILENNVAEFNKEDGLFYTLIKLITIASSGETINCFFANNKIEETEGFKRAGVKEGRSDNEIQFFDVKNVKIEHCTFLNAHNCLTLENADVVDCEFKNCDNILASNNCTPERHLYITNCSFQNCTRIMSCGLNTKVSKCTFTSCYGKLIAPGIYSLGGTNITNCTFRDIKYLSAAIDEDITSIMPCAMESEKSKEFYGVDACITFSYNDEDGKVNQISHCNFDGVELGKDVFLIQSVGKVEYDALEISLHRHKPYGTVAYVKDCVFSSISTKRKTGKIVKEYVQYDTIFNRKQNFLANIIMDCEGLENVNVMQVFSEYGKINNNNF